MKFYVEYGPSLLAFSSIVGTLACKLLKTSGRWYAGVVLALMTSYLFPFFLLTWLTARTSSHVPILVGLIYVIIGAICLSAMFPKISEVIAPTKFKEKLEFYEKYWLVVALVGVIIDMADRFGILHRLGLI